MTARYKIVGVTSLSIVAFVLLALIVKLDLSPDFDRAVLVFFRTAGDFGDPLGPPWFEEAAADITSLGGYAIISLIGILVLMFLWSGRRVRDIRFLMVTVVTGSLVSTGLKLLFARARPDLVGQLDKVFTSSFPSAHAMMSTVFYLSIAIVILRAVQHRAGRNVVIGGAILTIILVSVSRVYLGVHWPTDVMAGWAAGGAWVGICWLVLEREHLGPEPGVSSVR